MNFANVVKKNSDAKIEIVKEEIKEIEKIEETDEPVESKWSSHFSFNIIDLFSTLKYDFNILFDKCDINLFFDFVIKNSTIYDPHQVLEESESEEEEEFEYFSD